MALARNGLDFPGRFNYIGRGTSPREMKKRPLKMMSLLVAMACGSCVFYKPEPIDLRRDMEEWKRVSMELVKPGRALRVEELKRIGLLLNADLNKARLTLLRTAAAAEYAGLWKDPGVSAGVDRYLAGRQWDANAGLALTLPVTGLPSLARKVAECYKAADYYALRALESDYLVRLQALCYTIRVAHTKHAIIRARMGQVETELASMTRLQELGEATTGDLQDATQRYNDTVKELQELDNEHIAKHLELISMLGLHPAVGEVEVADALPSGVPTSVPAPTMEQLLRHPSLLAAMAEYGKSEKELQLEIRKQYPELEIGPTFTHEEGNNKLGLSVGFTLPLWNRNREGIARAQGSRALSRHGAVQQWRDLVQRVSALYQRQELAARHCRAEHARLTALQSSAARQEELFRLGEMGLPDIAAARQEMHARRLAYLDCLAELLEIQVAFQSLSTP